MTRQIIIEALVLLTLTLIIVGFVVLIDPAPAHSSTDGDDRVITPSGWVEISENAQIFIKEIRLSTGEVCVAIYAGQVNQATVACP